MWELNLVLSILGSDGPMYALNDVPTNIDVKNIQNKVPLSFQTHKIFVNVMKRIINGAL